MRGDADPATARGEPSLIHAATRAARHAGAAVGVLLLLTLATGAARSVFLPALVGAVIAWIRFERRPVVLLTPIVAAVLLAAVTAWQGEFGAAALSAVLITAAATYPGLLWRREVRRTAVRMAQLDDVVGQVHRSRNAAAPTAADELSDLERALEAVAARIGARAVVLWDADGYRGTARPRAGSGTRSHGVVRLAGDPLGWAWEQGMRLRLETPPRWADPTLIVVADRLRRSGDVGDIVTYAFQPERLPADDLPFDEAAVYLRGILAFQEARAGADASQRRLHTLVHGLRSIPGELDVETLAPELCQTAMALVDGTGAAIGLWSGEHGAVLATAGEDGGPRPGDIFGPPAAELALAVRAEAMLVRSAPDWTLGRTCVAHPHERWQARPRALAALPLRGHAGVIGVLAVWTSRESALDPAGLDLLHMLTPYAALHLEHARAFGTLRESAERDPLTLLRNRRAFDEIFTTEASRFERYGRPLAMLMLDLDHFKAVNDRFGHEAGDEVLRRTARIVESCIRDVDAAARLGGEEFAVLMPETSLGAAVEVAERIRVSIGATPIPWRGSSIPVRVSIGVSAAPESVAVPAGLIAAADAALYQAKASGRDRVVAAEPERGRARRGALPQDQ